MTHKNVVHTFTWWQQANPMPQRTPLTPHNSFRYKPFMANGTNFFIVWELVYLKTPLFQVMSIPKNPPPLCRVMSIPKTPPLFFPGYETPFFRFVPTPKTPFWCARAHTHQYIFRVPLPPGKCPPHGLSGADPGWGAEGPAPPSERGVRTWSVRGGSRGAAPPPLSERGVLILLCPPPPYFMGRAR